LKTRKAFQARRIILRRFIAFQLAAVCAASALSPLGLSTAASASAAPVARTRLDWGTLTSANRLAKASGYFDIRADVTDAEPDGNTVHASARLWDRDRGGKCAYIEFLSTSLDAKDKNQWSHKWYKKCGIHGYKQIDFQLHNVDDLRFKLCQVGKRSKHPVKCVTWYYNH
jgi:hypothetical protein